MGVLIRTAAALMLALLAFPAAAQVPPVQIVCGVPPTPCSDANPFPTTATLSGTISVSTALTAISTLPTLGAGTNIPQGSLAGAAYVQPAFGTASGGGTQVDLTHGLPVQPQTGSTFPISAASLPLPAGAATSALQSTINTTLGTLFPANGALGASSAIIGTVRDSYASGTQVDLTHGLPVQPQTGSTFPISAVSLPLPTGAFPANGALGTSSAIIGTVRESYGSGTLVDLTHGLPVQLQTGTTLPVTPATGSFTNRSGSITAGGTSQTLAAVNASRERIIIQNPCSTSSQGIGAIENLFINFTSPASQTGGSIELLPCGTYDTSLGPVTTEAITVVAATTGHLFTSKEQ